ncbi:TPA: hypothetical protein ACG7OS_005007, partial [Escherichia coli]
QRSGKEPDVNAANKIGMIPARRTAISLQPHRGHEEKDLIQLIWVIVFFQLHFVQIKVIGGRGYTIQTFLFICG